MWHTQGCGSHRSVPPTNAGIDVVQIVCVCVPAWGWTPVPASSSFSPKPSSIIFRLPPGRCLINHADHTTIMGRPSALAAKSQPWCPGPAFHGSGPPREPVEVAAPEGALLNGPLSSKSRPMIFFVHPSASICSTTRPAGAGVHRDDLARCRS